MMNEKELAATAAETITDTLGLDCDLLTTRKRDFPIARARHILAVLMLGQGLSLKETGAAVHRHHSDIVNSRTVHRALWDTDPTYRKDFIRCASAFYSTLGGVR